jgi:arylsulfatase A-like enzyme
VYFLADDMGLWAAGAYGNPEIFTPNIDKLAEQGLKFENAFCNTPVCSASRSSYFTGRLPSQHGVHDWISAGNGCGGDKPINYTLHETAYTDVLAKHNYTCAISGKYHLGAQPFPQHSFTHWFVHQSGGGDYNDPPLVKDGQCVNIEGYITDIITNDAISFLNDYVDSKNKKPFYLSVHYTSPHSPYVGSDGKASSMHPKEIVDLYEDANFTSCPQEPKSPYAREGTPLGGLTNECLGNRECLKGYYAAVTAMDLNIGRILNELEILSLQSDTLVVFSSDHGFNAGHHGLWGKGNAVYPINMFETSVRIPMIWYHPGVIKPGVENSVVQVVDIAPTLLDYAGSFRFEPLSIVAGKSFKDLLLDPSSRNSMINRTIYGEYGQTRYARINGTVKYVTRLSGHLELYDLLEDSGETVNLLEEYATPLASVAYSYETALRKWFSFYEEPYTSGWTLPVTGTGQRRSIIYNGAGWPNTPAFDKVVSFPR